MLIDSHCHLDFPELADNLDEIMANMAAQGVGYALCVSVSLEDFPKVRVLAERHTNVFASVGVHPDYENVTEPTAEKLAELAEHPKVVAIGETGLDYYRLQGGPEWQRQRFRNHIRAARISGKPLIVHTRSAAADTLSIMEEEGAASVGGIMHCFTETLEVAERAMDLNFYISFSGIITFRNAAALREVARKVPLERILVETDSPYLAPVPHRGKTNQPAYVRHIAEEIARIKDLAPEVVAEATTRNFFRLIGYQGGDRVASACTVHF
jgi:TatD DNase family protein